MQMEPGGHWVYLFDMFHLFRCQDPKISYIQCGHLAE